MAVPVYKIIVDGASGVGKSTFITRIRHGEPDVAAYGSANASVSYLRMASTYGDLCFELWDLAGNEALRDIDDSAALYSRASGLLVFYDGSRPATLDRALRLAETHAVLSPVLCHNKVDLSWNRPLTVSLKTSGSDSVRCPPLSATTAKSPFRYWPGRF